MAEKLTFDDASAAKIEPYLPSASIHSSSLARPFITLTFATSLDSCLSLAPGVRTRLSGPESKEMTHFLRSKHDAILIGISTMLADDPGLNCRISGVEQQPRPILIDPHLRWKPSESDKVLQTCRSGSGLAPYVVTAISPAEVPPETVSILSSHGGKLLHVHAQKRAGSQRLRFDWGDVFMKLQAEGLASIMVEGGGQIINSLLDPDYHSLIDTVIITIAPTWLGKGGVMVSPDQAHDESGAPLATARLQNVKWHPFGEDVVMCGTFGSRAIASS
ncbi:hypothetical protein Golomagni_08314 [Golovinomyces magnicellulatus]|nr:hypothetical protein Golomagni_08314 [Golovinomyces magnicellulatus]